MHTSTKTRRSRGRSGIDRGYSFSRRPKNSGKRHGGHKMHTPENKRGGRGPRAKRVMPTFDPSQFIKTNPVDVSPEVYTPKHHFGAFGLDTRLTENIASLGLATPSPIQDSVIPEILNGRDVIGIAETGTGKTAAFLIPLIEKTLRNPGRETLVLAPTRELAIQIESDLHKLSKGHRTYSVTCVGGVNIRPQIQALRQKNHFVIGTPGRIQDLMNRGNLTLNAITTVVLDEADRMLDMGFINDMKKILSKTPRERETLLFCATMSPGTKELMHEFLRNPVTVSVKKREVTNSVEQNVVPYHALSKFETLTTLLKDPSFKRVLVFGGMKHSVKKLAQQLTAHDIPAESIHGNKTHAGRQKALLAFKNGKVRILVATDVAARGIHISDVTHVVNYDLPGTFEDYVHRIGRTGRGEKRGKALTFVLART